MNETNAPLQLVKLVGERTFVPKCQKKKKRKKENSQEITKRRDSAIRKFPSKGTEDVQLNKTGVGDQIGRDELTSKRGNGTTLPQRSIWHPDRRRYSKTTVPPPWGPRPPYFPFFPFFFLVGPFGGRSQCRKVVGTI